MRHPAAVLALLLSLAACDRPGTGAAVATPAEAAAVAARGGAPCLLVEDGHGPEGTVAVRVETVVSGLVTPWGLAFLPNGDWLVTERNGAVRLVRGGRLVEAPVATAVTAPTSEGGLLGIALHPDFEATRLFFLYVTARQGGREVNRVERWRLAPDGTTAERERVLLDGIPAATYHDGGRLRVGPDGMLYVGTGDARAPARSQDPRSLSGKILRLTPGGVPADNPLPGSPAYVLGLRNTQGFDWAADGTLWVTDHGPTGELGRRGHDEVSVARPGANLGWPEIYGCETREGMATPAITWQDAAPPGGAAVYTGTAIPEWRGSLLIGTLRSEHLQRVVIEDGRVARHEVYLAGQFGRLREVVMGPDGHLYVTTSNCDGRGVCEGARDRILRITR
jgi:glucose/arabinose dehydrogenase